MLATAADGVSFGFDDDALDDAVDVALELVVPAPLERVPPIGGSAASPAAWRARSLLMVLIWLMP